MVAEVFGGISALKAAFDMTERLLAGIADKSKRDRLSINLQKEILAAQSAQTELVEEISSLKAKIASFETWEAEKKKYKLKDLGWGALAYILKPEARTGEPPHWVCTNCFGNKKISIIENFMMGNGRTLISILQD